MGKRRLTPQRVWLTIPALIVVADPYLIRSGQLTLTEQGQRWKVSHPVLYIGAITYLYLHLLGRPHCLRCVDPLSIACWLIRKTCKVIQVA